MFWMKLLMLIAADLALGVAAIFGILFVTAADHPSSTQGTIAWLLLAVLLILAVALVALMAIGVRTLVRARQA